MGRIRTIKPGFFQHEELSALDAETQLLAAGLLCYSDDEGYFNANPKLVEAAVFPVRTLKRKVVEMLSDLQTAKYLRLGQGEDGRTYGHIINFLEHQVINRPKPSEIKELQISWSSHGNDSEHSVPEGKGNRKQETGNRNGASAFRLPDWVPSSEWADFVEMRKKLRKPLTTKAMELTVNKLWDLKARGHPPELVLNQSIEHGWQTVYELKGNYGDNTNKADIFDRISKAREVV